MKITFIPVIFLTLSSHLVYADTQVRIYGEAKDIQSSELSYTEEHLISHASHTVTYRQANGDVMADKNIHYTQGYSTPNFELYDHRFGRTYGSKWQDGEWRLWQQEKNGERDEKVILPEKNLVIDAGFNHFVLEHFKELEQGKALEFSFAITNPPMEIPMTIKVKSCTDEIFSSAGETAICLKIVTHNIIFRLFVPVIYLAYIHNPEDSLSHLLSLYQGPSNLPDDHDKKQNVRINYRYEFVN